MKPFPPGRLSTTSCWRHVFASFSPTRRSAESGPLPVGNGVSTRTGFTGYVWAMDGAGTIKQSNDASAVIESLTGRPFEVMSLQLDIPRLHHVTAADDGVLAAR